MQISLHCFFFPWPDRVKFSTFFMSSSFVAILENNKTRDNKFILLQQDKTKCKSSHDQLINNIKVDYCKIMPSYFMLGRYRNVFCCYCCCCWEGVVLGTYKHLGIQGGRLFKSGWFIKSILYSTVHIPHIDIQILYIMKEIYLV